MTPRQRRVAFDGGGPTPTDRPGPLVVQSDGRIVSLNDAAVVLFGADDRNQLLGQRLGEFVRADDGQTLERTLDRIRECDFETLGLRLSIETLDGDTRDVIAVGSPVDWDGTRGVQTTFLNITGDGQTVPTLREQAMHAAPVGISIADARADDLPVIYVNDGFVELTGYPRDEVIGRNCRFLQGEATRDEPVDRMREAIECGEAAVVELRNYRKDGTMFWNRVTLSPVRNRDSEVTHYLGFQEDVSETKVFEDESTLFETQIAAAGQAMLITDRDGTIEYVNPTFEEVTGYTAQEAIGQDPSILKSGEQDGEFYKGLWETIAAGDVWRETLWNRTKSGEYYRATETIVPVTDDRGEITNFVAIQTEVTRDEIRDQILQVLDRVLRHNIRNTVTAITGFASVLEGRLTDPDQIALVERIQSSAEDLASIGERMTPIFEVFRGVYEPEPWPVRGLVEAVEAHREAHAEADISVDCRAPNDAWVTHGQSVSITVMEALENAVVHSDRASPTVEITLAAVDDPPHLRIEIADDGPGVPAEEWEIVQSGVEQPLSHTSGIGLWMINWMTTAIGGWATMSANDPRGTVVCLEVPLEGAAATERE